MNQPHPPFLSQLRHPYITPISVILILLFSWLLSIKSPPAVALWPAIASLTLVLITKKVTPSLLIGSITGAILITEGNLWKVPSFFLESLLLNALTSEWNLCVIIFTILMGGLIGLIDLGAGLQNLISWLLTKSRNSRKNVEWLTMLLGFICFFDGLANSLFVGRIMRPFTDRASISREKLAYIVDTTSSPLACLAFVSTWVAYQLSMIREGFEIAGKETSEYEIFLSSIPFQFYCWLSLIILAFAIHKQWGTWPSPITSSNSNKSQNSPQPLKPNLQDILKFILPITTLWLSILAGLIWFSENQRWPHTLAELRTSIGEYDTAKILVISAFTACLVAWLLNQKKHKPDRLISSFQDGSMRMLNPVLILIAAWCLNGSLKALETDQFLASLLNNSIPLSVLPTAIFLLAVLISFTTGTSWGTMGILMPLAIPIAFTLLSSGTTPTTETETILIPIIVGAVFSGAVFGDHCSPMSDTTIVSAAASECAPLSHVKTQLPFALTAGALATFLYLLTGIIIL